jgi:hypothetical protein
VCANTYTHTHTTVETLKLVVTAIMQSLDNGTSWVYLSKECWSATNQSINAKFTKQVPLLTFQGGKDITGKGVRTFIIEGVEVHSHYDDATGKRYFIMDTAAAQAHYDASQDTWTDRVVDLDIAKFDFSKTRAR